VHRLLALLAYIRTLELVFVVVLMCQSLSLEYVRLYISVVASTLALLAVLAMLVYMLREHQGIVACVAALALITLDSYMLAILMSRSAETVFMYVSATVNVLVDIVLLLLSIELIRR